MTEIGAEMPEVVSTMPTTTVPETNNANDSLPLNASLKCEQDKSILESATAKDENKLVTDNDGDDCPVVDSNSTQIDDSAVVTTKDITSAAEDSGTTTTAEVTAVPSTVASSEDKAEEAVSNATAGIETTEPKTITVTANVDQNKIKENGADTAVDGRGDSTTDAAASPSASSSPQPKSPSPPPNTTEVTPANALSSEDADKKQVVVDGTAVNSDENQPETNKQSPAASPTATILLEKQPSPASQKENGIAEKRPSNDGGIVDLGDDTDDEIMQETSSNTDKETAPKLSIEQTMSSAGENGHDLTANATVNSTSTTTKTSSIATPLNLNTSSTAIKSPSSNEHNASSTVLSDSDGAVVINSDSDNEEILSRKPNEYKRLSLPPPTAATTTMSAAQQQSAAVAAALAAAAAAAASSSSSASQQIVDDDDDDDDDCVVIEDNTPAPNSDLNKRKSLVAEENIGEDLQQPPSKRMRSSMLGASGDPLNIHMDTRISVPDTLNIKKVNENNIYPVTITPSALNTNQGPPKLVPMSTTSLINANVIGANAASITQTAVGIVGGATALGSNAALLPGLTDDMFVLEAPSFIVPYIYEKPPAVGLNEVVKEIEAKHNLTKEDLAMADKTDDFDMMTEQNKTEKLDADSKKKKKRKGGDDGDESWSEQSEEEEDDDDDDDSDQGVKTKVLIKEATDDLTALQGAIKPSAAVAQPAGGVTPNSAAAKPGQENYFESPLGKFFMDIGVGLVQEFVQSDLIKLQKRKMRKSLGKNTMEFERAISALSGNLEASKRRNSPFKFTMKRCEFCNFKSESALAMANHYETPHMNGPLYKCNFCTFEIRNATEIVYHMEAVHNIKARLIKPLPYHQCPNCGFEDNGKAKMARHQPVCAKKFRPELNLAPTNDWEAPAKIPRIKPRHGLVGTATAYQAMAAQAAAQKAALATIQQQQQVQQQQRTLQAAAMAAQTAANKMRGRAPIVPKAGPNTPGGMIRQPHPPIRTPMASNVVLQNNYQLPGNQLLQNAANAMAKKANAGGQPSISITPLPRQAASPTTAASTSKVPAAGVKPGQSPGSSKAQFVICEICDGYIKDLEQLRNHMQWMHKVKIHPKMIYNRPPLNCQKCQFRFFTDQGLERHLLGSHGLVTSSMQEAANKGKDSGRCPVCGRMYQWKLLNHVSRDHHMTLKPAHLSYKCTVCTATFGMYKQFETHVYTAHSTVAKRAMDGKKTNAPGPSGSAGGSGSSSSQRLPTTNDSILKPLKINDEITIIPQPATKPRITNVESHVID